ncbi:hypothetical protein [Ostreiculturibacter nitratireducens]|uniref:capsular polysaccharide export protein, LipB/KpsS family n=1 Tax=Ostreiculturibacter nitratireducens TaxID=3075226 RepID=UPI0031B568F7
MAKARIIIHLPGSVILGAEPLKQFYRSLREGLIARGARVEFAIHDRATLPGEVEADEDFHIVDHGNLRHPRVLNTGIAYVYPFWHLDPWGIRAGSSIEAKEFDPQAIDTEAAAEFMEKLRRRQVQKRASRYPQPEERVAFPEGCIAVFLQSEAHRQVEETCHLDRATMVEALLARDDSRPIVVKIHPRDTSAGTRDWLGALAARDGRVIVTEANIHDILASAAVTVTINSAVGIESMIHEVPVVLCGRADFHHAAITVERAEDLDAAIMAAERGEWDFPRYLYWYFRLNCVGSGSGTLIDDVLARISATGFDTGRFGLSS